MNRARNNITQNNLNNNMDGRVGGVTNNNGMNGYNNRDGVNGRTDMNGYNNRDGVNGRTDMNGYNNRGDMNGRNGMSGRNPNGGALTGSLAEQIRALCFVKTELELYLDTHPRCRTALDYYYKTIEELKRLTEMYENTTGPLTAAGNVSTEQWNWVDGPWPWQQAGDFMREGEDR